VTIGEVKVGFLCSAPAERSGDGALVEIDRAAIPSGFALRWPPHSIKLCGAAQSSLTVGLPPPTNTKEATALRGSLS